MPPRSVPRCWRAAPARAKSATAPKRSARPIAALGAGDALVIAGKGHERGQIVGTARSGRFPIATKRSRPRSRSAAKKWRARHERAVDLRGSRGRATLGHVTHGFEADRHFHRHPHAGAGRSCSSRSRAKTATAMNSWRRLSRPGPAAAMVARAPDRCAGRCGASDASRDTQRGLEDLGRASRARSNAKIVAVTGSAGKTTTKEMLRLAFGALGRTHASAASYNNHWGVPLTLAAHAARHPVRRRSRSA